MLIQSISTQPPTRATQPANRDGFVPSASYMRSGGTLSIEADSAPTLATDTVQFLDSTMPQKITDFLETATGGTPEELESQFLASVLDKHLVVGKNIDGTVKDFQTAVVVRNASRVKLLTYLQTDDLDGAFRLLNGSHPPVLEKEVKWKYNPFNWVQNKMQAYVQAQPIHDDLPSELASFEAFEKHVKNLRRQVGLYLGTVEKPKGGALLAPKASKAIIKAIEATRQQLNAIKKESTDLASLEHEALLEKAISHHLQESPDSAKMLKIAWLQDLLEQVKNTKTAEGKSLLEIHEIQHFLRGLILSLDGGNSEEKQLLTSALAQLAPGKAGILAPVPKSIVDGVGDLVTNAHAISRVNMGLSPDLLALLPKELQSPVALQTARETFQQGLLTGSQKVLDFAKSQLVSPEAKEGLIQAYRLWLGQQAVRLEHQLVQLEKMPIVGLPAFLQKLPKATQHQLEAVIENSLTLPPVEGMKQLKAVMVDIPKDIRHVVQQFIASEHQRLAEMRVTESKVQQQLAGQVEKVVGGVQEVFNPAEISRQVNDFTTEMMPALQVEVVVPVVKLAEAVVGIPVAIQSQAELLKAKILAELNTRILDPVKSKADQVTEVINKATDSIGQAVQSVVNPAKTGNGATTPAVVVKLPLPVSDGIAFAKPLKVVEAQGEKVGWFPALMEQNKEWLPWAIGGTVGLGLLATIGVWVSKKRKSSSEVGASNNR